MTDDSANSTPIHDKFYHLDGKSISLCLEINLIKTQPLQSVEPKIKNFLGSGENLQIDLMKTQPKNKKAKIENSLACCQSGY